MAGATAHRRSRLIDGPNRIDRERSSAAAVHGDRLARTASDPNRPPLAWRRRIRSRGRPHDDAAAALEHALTLTDGRPAWRCRGQEIEAGHRAFALSGASSRNA